MLVGVVGKTNVGKSAFFSAATLVDVEISNRIFTTIKPNTGAAYARAQCPHVELKLTCAPRNSKCANGIRLIPVQLMDVAGLVPGAHEGRGLGNQFLDDLRQANALVNVIDVSGGTDSEGQPVPPGSHDPAEDITLLETEFERWLAAIVAKGLVKPAYSKEPAEERLARQLSGLGVTVLDAKRALEKVGEDKNRLAHEIRLLSKPMLVAANKIDVPGADKLYEKLKKQMPNHMIVPCSAESELALRKAAAAGAIDYTPGASEFKILKELPEKQRGALNFIKTAVLDKFGSTGVQQAIDAATFDLLKQIVVYPVEDENKFANHYGQVLPDAILLPQGAGAYDLAAKIHTDLAKAFVCGVDARTKRKLGRETPLKSGDIVRIVAKA